MTNKVSLDRDQAGSPEQDINCAFDAALAEGRHPFLDALMARPSERKSITDLASESIDFRRGICFTLSEI
jgi:predicted kinase